jgi:hypothetical protein
MGNCNSMSIEDQKCKGCGYPTNCDCTAGLNNYCGRCDPTWKTAAIGTYDDKYDAWVKANPRPVKPVFDPQPPIVAGDFICVQCTQCQEFTNVTAGGNLQMDPSQAQQCIGKLQNKLDAAKAADAGASAAITPVAIPGAVAVPGGVIAPPTPAINPMMYLVIFAFLFLIIIAVFLATRSKTGQGEFVLDPAFAGACEC